jgi:hypothetical protein
MYKDKNSLRGEKKVLSPAGLPGRHLLFIFGPFLLITLLVFLPFLAIQFLMMAQ